MTTRCSCGFCAACLPIAQTLVYSAGPAPVARLVTGVIEGADEPPTLRAMRAFTSRRGLELRMTADLLEDRDAYTLRLVTWARDEGQPQDDEPVRRMLVDEVRAMLPGRGRAAVGGGPLVRPLPAPRARTLRRALGLPRASRARPRVLGVVDGAAAMTVPPEYLVYDWTENPLGLVVPRPEDDRVTVSVGRRAGKVEYVRRFEQHAEDLGLNVQRIEPETFFGAEHPLTAPDNGTFSNLNATPLTHESLRDAFERMWPGHSQRRPTRADFTLCAVHEDCREREDGASVSEWEAMRHACWLSTHPDGGAGSISVGASSKA